MLRFHFVTFEVKLDFMVERHLVEEKKCGIRVAIQRDLEFISKTMKQKKE